METVPAISVVRNLDLERAADPTGEQASSPASAHPMPVTFEPRSRTRLSPKTLAVLAVVAGLGAMALGAAALVARGNGGTGSQPLPSEAERALTLLSKPSTERIPFRGSGGTAVLAVGSGGRAAIVLRGFAPATEGLEHRAWVLVPGENPAAAGAFTGSERVVLLSALVAPGTRVGITSEPEGAAGPPTSPPQVVATRP